MYQTTISTEHTNKHYLAYIKNAVAPILKKTDGVCAQSDKGNKSYLSVACTNEHKEQVQTSLCAALSDVLSVAYKNSYFKRKMKLNHPTLLQNVVVDTMCIFDVHKDKKTILRELHNIDNLSIEGYCNFRMRNICAKWDEIIEITDAYEIITANSTVIKDFLVFLVEAIPSTQDKIVLALSNDKFSLFDEKGNLLNNYTSFLPIESYAESLIHNLICYHPSIVYVIGSSKRLNDDFWKITQLLFSVREYKS